MILRLLGNRWIGFFILLSLLTALLTYRTQDHDWAKSLRFIAFDTYNKLKPREKTDLVTMVDIDETSLKRKDIGQWTWSRTLFAEMVEKLTAMGAKAIVFDIVFPEEDRTSPDNFYRSIARYNANAQIEEALKVLPDNDVVFAESIKQSGKVVTGFTRATTYQDGQPIPRAARPILFAKSAQIVKDNLTPLYAITASLPEFEKAAAGNGSFAAKPEIDGLIRQVSLMFQVVDKNGKQLRVLPSLAVEAVRVAENPRQIIKVGPYAGNSDLDPPFKMLIGKNEIPMTSDGKIYVYFAHARPEEYVPAWKVFDNAVDPARIKDKIVIIGTSAEGLRDIRSTPLDLFIPGVEVHINAIEQILTKTYLKRPDIVAGAEVFFIGLIGLGIIILAAFIGPLFLGAFTSVLILGIVFLSWQAYVTQGLLLDPVYPSLCLFILFVTSSLLSYMRTEAERKQVREAFGLYISPDFMKELEKNPDQLKLGGNIKDISVMFTDIRSFTTISESLTPEELIQLMNDFLTPMSDLVMNNRGTIDKYMGDAMMAFWNAPLDDEDHIRHACITALKMDDALAPINKALAKKAAAEGKDPIILNAGIGINSGPASVGNMGSKQRFAYSALGDTVNLASRLESQTKNYGTNILIGEETKNGVPDFATLEVDLIQVKGKTQPVHIFALLGDADYAQSPEFQKWKKTHDEMIEKYRGQEFEAAKKLVEKARKLADGKIDITYDLYKERTTAMIEHTPGEGWNGVFVATRK